MCGWGIPFLCVRLGGFYWSRIYTVEYGLLSNKHCTTELFSVKQSKNFEVHFLYFGKEKTRVELMHLPDINLKTGRRGSDHGMAYFAIYVGLKDNVNQLTERLWQDYFTIASEPKTAGDGYYESAVPDPEGNYVEITT